MKNKDITVILTVKNDAEALRKTLRALEKQTQQPAEVVITVATSVDDTLQAAKEWNPPNISTQVECIGNHTRSQGRNRGVALATGDILAFTDAGCLPQTDWLEKLTVSLFSGEASLVAGLTIGDTHSPWEEAQIPFVLVPASRTEKHPLPATRNMVLTRQTWEKIGPFAATLNYAEDFEWSRRARQLGIHAQFVPEARVAWRPRATVREYFQMIVRLTQGDMLAGTWRLGHATMVERYIFFALIFGWSSVFLAFRFALAVTIATWMVYLWYKVSRFADLRPAAKWWAALLQVVTDGGVLWGVISGLALRWQKADNKAT